jgi:hypothetical protein
MKDPLLPCFIQSDVPAPLRGLCFVLAGLALSEASAQELTPQTPKQRGSFLVPMLTVAETFDDNLSRSRTEPCR